MKGVPDPLCTQCAYSFYRLSDPVIVLCLVMTLTLHVSE